MTPIKEILITGATGNIGSATIKAWFQEGERTVYVGVRNLNDSSEILSKARFIEKREFDFLKPVTWPSALEGIDTLMLIRPPQISDIATTFKPLLKACQAARVQHIVFLSVQGVENMSFIPHAKIEKLILEGGFAYTFIRPSYFMQNFLMDLHKDLVVNNRIFLPAGQAYFNLVDTRDLGEVFAKVLLKPEQFENQQLEVTGDHNHTFTDMASILSQKLGRTITYKSPSLISFLIEKKKEHIPLSKILVMALLHYLPRFSKNKPRISSNLRELFGIEVSSFESFINRHKKQLSSPKSQYYNTKKT